MPDPSGCEAALDPNFIETIELLNKHNIPYWACHGTLLGLIRDGGLIPWDHDIDIALWAESFSKKSLIELMLASGYSLKSDGADYDFVAFTKRGGREVDFNYYRIFHDSGMAYSEWFISRSKWTDLLDVIANRSEYHGKLEGIISQLYFFSPMASWIVRCLKKTSLFYKSAGYTTPADLLRESKHVEISDLKVRVPLPCESVLEYVYGNSWRVPRKQYDWTKESPSTRISNDRFT